MVVKRAHVLDPLGRRRFTREARLGGLLKINGVAAILDSDHDWIAFEPLTDLFNMKPPAWGEVEILRVLQKVATTLGHLHAHGIVHRDLKPSHILFRGHEPVIIDLGVAGLIGDDPLEGTEVVGSPAWMAPEQTMGAPPAPAADIWSLCAIAYWLLCGRALHTGYAASVLEARQNGYVYRPDLSALKNHRLAEILAAGFDHAGRRPRASEFAEAVNPL